MDGPVLVYDDDCGFCTWWAEYLADRASFPIAGFSELTPELRERLPENYEDCSHLVTEERVYSCGASIEEALLRSDVGSPARPVVERLREVSAYNDVREWGYRWVADNRGLMGKIVSKPTGKKRS